MSLNILRVIKSTSYRLFISMLIILPVTFPFSRKLSIYILIGIIVFQIIYGGIAPILNSFKNKGVLIFTSLFFVLLLSITYSSNDLLFSIEKKVSLLIFPVIISASTLNSNFLRYSLASFVLGCVVLSVYSLVYTIQNNGSLDTEMTINAVGLSHVYSSMYIVFSIVILMHLINLQQRIYFKFIIGIILLFLLFFLFFFGGKMAIISLITLLFIGSVYFIIKNKNNRFVRVIILILPIALFIISILNFDNVRSRFSYLVNKEHYFVGDNAWSSIAVRFTVYACSYEIYKKSPVLGLGLGDVQHELDDCYKNRGFGTVVGMNAHNQYIQLLLSSGVLGLLSFLVILTFSFLKAKQTEDTLLFSFTFIILMCCLTESILERQQGIMFYSYFGSLFYFKKQYSARRVLP